MHIILEFFVDTEILYQDKFFSESVINEISVHMWELARGINSLKELAWAGNRFL